MKRFYRGFTIFVVLVSVGFAQDKAKAEYGLSLYKSYYCGLCHQNTVAGTEGIFGPPHDALGIISESRILDPNYTGKAVTAAEYLLESSLEPELYVVPGYEFGRHRMPSYKHMTEEELDALIYFLLNQEEVLDN